MPTVLSQQTYIDAKQNPAQLGHFLLDALNYGDRAVAGPNNSGFSSWAQIYADLSASGIDPVSIGLPALDQITTFPGYNPDGSPKAAVMIGVQEGTGPSPLGGDDDQMKPPDPVTLDPVQLRQYKVTVQFLQDVGLGYLATVDSNGNPGGWVWDNIVKNGITDPVEVQQLLDDNADWRERFAPMYEQRKQAANGQAVQILTPAQIREFEQQAMTTMRAYGMPPDLYDNYKDFQKLMINGVSPRQLENAVIGGWAKVQGSPQEVRDYFAENFGPAGDSALAAFYLDNAQFEDKLDKITRTATIGGTARGLGIGLSLGTSQGLAGMGLEGESARQGLLNVAAMKELFQENFGEQDLTEEQGVRGSFGLDEADAARLKQRKDERVASFSGGGEGAYTQTGLLSARTAR